MFSPITAADNIKDEFIGYISTLFHISDKDYAAQFAAALREEGAIAKGPYLDVSDSYKTGKSLAQMIEEGEASSLFHSLEGDIPDGEKEIQINRGLYLHQERALRKTNKGKNLIVTTGTGSGKTECFIIPIINHLLREAEEGTLSSGVRAILIYPMNALANDQMKRLRNLLKSYPEITFGVYNSSTKQNEQDGIAEYGKVYKDANGRPLKPLKNEIVSRDQMQKTPPHILVTNYAMLEYMMLRPKDDLVFSRAKLRFLVLDEAHIYRGATGMETSLLLKRLKARISNPANVLHILTSATLGGKEADDDIVKFAETLCNASFYAEDIIRSQSVVPSYDREPVDVPLSMFAELIDPQKPLNVIADDYGLPIPDGIPDAEYLYDLCVSASVYRDLRRITSHPIEPRKGFVADAKPKDVPMRKPDKAFRSDDFSIGDAQRQVMQKYAFVMKDGNRFQMETSINDSLMVVCNDDFYVCPHCGYAESTMENMEVAGFNSHQKTLEKKHITPWGKNCEVKLVKNKLCHVFKTDVVRLVFSTPQAGNQEVMLSVMYALLEALSSVMDIERNDIKGCLHKIVYDNKLIYAIVLYDAVAGGAGHVRRLVTEDGRCFRQVVEKAIAITKGCNCSPSCYSCLRNYYNQKIHDLLNRKYAYDFLENYYGELEPITNEEFENGELYNV